MNEIREACMREWALGEFLIIDEMMVCYKGMYCPAHQYISKKPEKWGIKIWCLVDSQSKYVYNFDIYCGRNMEQQVLVGGGKGEFTVAHGVVTQWCSGLDYLGHYLTMYNFFSSIPLFVELASKEIYAMGTMRANRIGIPFHLKNTQAFKRVE